MLCTGHAPPLRPRAVEMQSGAARQGGTGMEPRLAALKAVLDGLDVPAAIETVEARKLIQKTIYLAQVGGVDIGYRYGWYKKGPYSTALTRDYYALDEAVALVGGAGSVGIELPTSVRASLDKVKPALRVPDGIALSPEDWLELVASLHYLRTVRRLSSQESLEILAKEKQHLARYATEAETALASVGLL